MYNKGSTPKGGGIEITPGRGLNYLAASGGKEVIP